MTMLQSIILFQFLHTAVWVIYIGELVLLQYTFKKGFYDKKDKFAFAGDGVLLGLYLMSLLGSKGICSKATR